MQLCIISKKRTANDLENAEILNDRFSSVFRYEMQDRCGNLNTYQRFYSR